MAVRPAGTGSRTGNSALRRICFLAFSGSRSIMGVSNRAGASVMARMPYHARSLSAQERQGGEGEREFRQAAPTGTRTSPWGVSSTRPRPWTL